MCVCVRVCMSVLGLFYTMHCSKQKLSFVSFSFFFIFIIPAHLLFVRYLFSCDHSNKFPFSLFKHIYRLVDLVFLLVFDYESKRKKKHKKIFNKRSSMFLVLVFHFLFLSEKSKDKKI